MKILRRISLVAKVLFGLLTEKTVRVYWLQGVDAWDSGLTANRIVWYGRYAFIEHLPEYASPDGRGRFELATIEMDKSEALEEFFEGFGK